MSIDIHVFISRSKTAILGGLVTLVGGLFSPLVNAANIVTNPGFETGDLSAWTVSGAHSSPAEEGISYGVDSLDPHSGTYGSYFGPVGGVLNLSQTLLTAPGASYAITFWLAPGPGTPAPYVSSFSATFGSNTLFSQTGIQGTTYTEYAFVANAISASSLLSFGFRNDTGFFSLDDISVMPVSNAIPEPAPALLLLPVLGVLAIYQRGRRMNLAE